MLAQLIFSLSFHRSFSVNALVFNILQMSDFMRSRSNEEGFLVCLCSTFLIYTKAGESAHEVQGKLYERQYSGCCVTWEKIGTQHCWAGGGCAAGEARLEEAAAFPKCVPVCLQLSERLRLTEIGVMVHTLPL